MHGVFTGKGLLNIAKRELPERFETTMQTHDAYIIRCVYKKV